MVDLSYPCCIYFSHPHYLVGSQWFLCGKSGRLIDLKLGVPVGLLIIVDRLDFLKEGGRTQQEKVSSLFTP